MQTFPACTDTADERDRIHVHIETGTLELTDDDSHTQKLRNATVTFISPREIRVRTHIHFHPPLLFTQIIMTYIKRYGFLHGLYLCHAASIYHQDRFFLIPGVEGRGKTTFCHLVSSCSMLNEDLTLVHFERHTQGHEKKQYLYAIPDMSLGAQLTDHSFAWRGPFELSATIFLRRNPPYGLRKLNRCEAVVYLKEDNPTRDFGCEGSSRVSEKAGHLYEAWIENLTGMYPAFVLSYHLSIHSANEVGTMLDSIMG